MLADMFVNRVGCNKINLHVNTPVSMEVCIVYVVTAIHTPALS